MKKLLLKNSVTGVTHQILRAILLFITIPIFIRLLGIEKYGIFSLLIVIGSLNEIINFGLNISLLKYLAEQGKCSESDFDIMITISLQLLFVIPITFLALIFNKFIICNVLGLPIIHYNETKDLFSFLLLSNGILLLGQTLSSIIDSIQKIYINNILQIIYVILYWGLIIFVLSLGYSLREIGLVIFITSIVWFFLVSFFVFKYWGKFCFDGLSNNFFRIVKKQLTYSIKVYTASIIGIFYEPFSKILLSHFVGITEVGFFDIALRLKSQVWGIFSRIFYPLFPFISKQIDKDIIRKYVHDS